MFRPITAWSYSRWSVYDKCPLQFKYKYIDKLPEAPSPAMEHGLVIHKRGEAFLNNDIKQVPKEFVKFKVDMQDFKKAKAKAEYDLAVTKTWEPTTYDDWDNVWCRAKADAVVVFSKDTISVVDFKTGRAYEAHADQAELMSLLCYSHFPNIREVLAELWYLDTGNDDCYRVSYKAVPKLRKKWENRARIMFKDTSFKAKPAPTSCGWCSFSKNKGGPCTAG